MQRGIEANAGGQGTAAVAGTAEQVGLGAFAQARLGELLDGVLLAILVDGEVDGAKGATANLLLDQVLVDAVLGGAVIFAVAVLGARIEGFLAPLAPKVQARAAVLLRTGTLTRLVLEAARRWCRSGLWYAGVDLGGDCQHVGGAALTAAGAHMYLTGAGRASSGLAGMSSVGRDE